MTDNTNIIIRERKSKLSTRLDEEKDVTVTGKNKKLSVKKKGECNVLRNQRKKNVKRGTKSKNICQKTTDKNTYERQIQQLNLMLKQSISYPKLTQEELNILFVKYKSDGHYRADENLQPFTNFLNETHAINENRQFYNQMQFVPDTVNTTANPYYDVNDENQATQENLSVYENIEPSLRTTEIPETTNTDNKLYTDQNPLYDNHYSCNVVNTEKERYNCMYTNKNLLYNIFDSNLQCENLNNDTILQSNDTHGTLQYNNDLLLNPDFCDDICSNNWNMDSNNNQSCKNGYTTYVAQTNDSKSYYDVNNVNLPIRENRYPVTNGKENLIHHFNDNTSTQQDCLESANANIISTNFSTEPNTLALSCANVVT